MRKYLQDTRFQEYINAKNTISLFIHFYYYTIIYIKSAEMSRNVFLSI